MFRRAAAVVLAGVVLGVGGFAASAAPVSQGLGPLHTLCSASYVSAVIGGEPKCLRAGEFCSPSHEVDYERYGFACVDGHLKSGAPTATTTTSPTTTTMNVGRSVALGKRTQTTGCTRGVLPDRQCSPGAYFSGLTRAVLCSTTFRTSSIRNVPDSEKHQVEAGYGMVPKAYGRTIEIDHIVSLELGGSNDISNLFPEPGSGPASYHVKDKLENKLHALVCSGSMTLRAAQVGISTNWRALYKTVYGDSP
jgi:hypothetical protein